MQSKADGDIVVRTNDWLEPEYIGKNFEIEGENYNVSSYQEVVAQKKAGTKVR